MAAVLALHGLLWLVLQAGWQRVIAPAAASRITMRLLPLIQPRPPSPPRPRLDASARPRDATEREPAPPLPTQAAPAAGAATSIAPSTAPTASPATERSTLTLSLPPQAASAPRNPALTDARTNTARLTLEEKIARALDGTVHQQVMADGTTIRRRVGNQCVDLHESRAVALMPDVDFLRYAPRAAGRTYDCK